jgi:hypothetical protein
MNAIEYASKEPTTLNPGEFEKKVEDFMQDDSDSSHGSSSEEDNADNSESLGYEEDSEAAIFFDEMEQTIQQLKVSEGNDLFSDLFDSMDSEGGGSVGPATALLAGIFMNRRK